MKTLGYKNVCKFGLLLMLAMTSMALAQAPVPFVEFNAATSAGVTTNGSVIGPNYYFGTLASEATGRKAVVLSGRGEFVSFTLTAPANAVTIHYAIPDAPAGNGITQPLSLYVNGALTTSLSLTSAYSWLYGAYTFSKTPGLGMPGELTPHDFYNDVRFMFSSTLPAGTVVKLQIDSGDNAPWYIINTADFEVAPAPIAAPAGSIDVTQSPYNADNTGGRDSTTALQNAINAASTSSSHPTVYFPAGTYTISSPLMLGTGNVTIEGAGEWYTVLTGRQVEFAGSISPPSSNVNISNLAIFGNVAVRNDGDGSVNGFNGGFSNSTISNVWIQNTKVGAWIVGPATNLTFDHMRIMDLKADGINFNAANGPVTSSTIQNSFFRNTQDDGIAMWAENAPDTGITITHNTVLSPGLANNIAIYGSGGGDIISNNLLEDPVTRGSCIHDGLRFSSVATSGPITIQNNTLQRCGQYDPGFFFGVGAIWFWPLDSNMGTAVNLSGNNIQDSPYSGYMFLGPNSTTGVTVSGDTLTNVGTFVAHTQGNGAATISNTAATGVADGGFINVGCTWSFTLTATGDTGWTSTPICSIPPANPLWVYPDIVTFQTTPGSPVTHQVAVINAAYEGTTIGPISASAGFTVSTDSSSPCGGSLVAATYGGAPENGWCIVDVTFDGSSSGITPGTLTIPNSAGSTVNVMLVGSAGGNTTNNPPTVSPASLTFGFLLVGQTTAAQNVTLTNPPGGAALSINSITTSTGYTQTNNCGSILAGGASCTISVKFAPTAAGTFNGSLAIANSATSTPITVSLSGTAFTSTTNLALGASATSSSTQSGFPASNVNDNNTSTYWESLDNAAFPQWIDLNFGQVLSLGSVTLNLPPLTSWTSRTETFSVQSSTNGTNYTTLIGSAGYTFNPATGNTVSFNLPSGTSATNLRLNFTANTGWPAAQLSEFQVFPGTISCTAGVPAAPTGLTATAISSTQINLSWMASSTSGVTYSVFRSTSSGFTPSAANQIASGLTGTTFSDTGLNASTTYFYVVQAVNCAGTASSLQASATTPSSCTAGVPAAPSGLTGTAVSSTQINLSWMASSTSGVTYSVFRSTTSGFTPSAANRIASGLTGTTFSDTGLNASTTYFYVVQAVNCAGTASSLQASATTPSSCTAGVPAPPMGLTATAVSSTQINLSWMASSTSGVTYSVFRSTSSGFTPSAANQIASGLTGTAFSNTGLNASTTYFYVVQAVNCAGTASSAQVSATTPSSCTAGVPAPPTGLTATAVSAAQINLSWTASTTSGVTYSVFRSTSSGFTPSAANQIASGLSGTTFSNTGLNASTTYFYVVQAVNCAGTASSAQASATTPSGGGSGTVIQINSGGPASGTWVADTDVAGGNTASTGAAIDTSLVTSPAPQNVYQTVRWGSFTYTIRNLTVGAAYTVNLHFAEITWTATGQRKFNVLVNGKQVLTNFDIIAAAGAPNKAVVESVATTANSSGQIVIQFTVGTVDNPEISGIEVIKGIASNANLSLGATATSSSIASGFPASNANDGNPRSYWESLNSAAFPQWVDLNFGSIQNIGHVTLRLPPLTTWATRTETLSVQVSTDGATYTTVVPSAGYTFNPATGNTVSFSLPAGTAARNVRLVFTANTGWQAAQLSELQVSP